MDKNPFKTNKQTKSRPYSFKKTHPLVKIAGLNICVGENPRSGEDEVLISDYHENSKDAGRVSDMVEKGSEKSDIGAKHS